MSDTQSNEGSDTQSNQGRREKPDPSEVESIDLEKYCHERDSDGNLYTEDAVILVGGEWQSISHVPPTRGLLARIDRLFGDQSDVEFEKIDEVMGEFYPELGETVENWDDVDARLYIPAMENMVSYLEGGVDDSTLENLQESVEERAEAGN